MVPDINGEAIQTYFLLNNINFRNFVRVAFTDAAKKKFLILCKERINFVNKILINGYLGGAK
jgi:hypothetical protein